MITEQLEVLLAELTYFERIRLLSIFGHEMTIVGRLAYEFRAPGVTNPRMLREINEVQHQIHNMILSYSRDDPGFLSPKDFLELIIDKAKGELRSSLPQAFSRTVERYKSPHGD